MSMTRKNFNAIANAVNIDPADLSATALKRDIAKNIADVCADTNPNFDRARFLEACGVEISNA